MMSEQTRIKPLEQAYYDECGTERTDKDRPNYKHWLEQRVTQLEAMLNEHAALKRVRDAAVFLRSKPINTNPEWVKPLDDALKESG